MAKKQLTLSIPTPCTEDWNAMTPDKNGKFCASCQKSVVDFSRMTDAEIFKYFDTFKGSTCGRFTEKQLSTPIIEPWISTPQNRWAWALSALLLPTVAASQTVKPSKINDYYTPSVFRDNTAENDLPIEKTLRGVVLDSHNEALVGVPVVLKGTNIGTVTDIDGHFDLKFSSKEVTRDYIEIQANYPGFDTFSLRINASDINKELKIRLKELIVPIEVVTISYQGGVKAIFEENSKIERGGVSVIRGVVWDDNYEILPAASVVLKGTMKGTLTDINGRFELALNVEDITNDSFAIVASYIGYTNKELRISPSEIGKDLVISLGLGMVLGGYEHIVVPLNFFQRTKYRIKRFFRKLSNR